jgi:hypothetical protein
MNQTIIYKSDCIGRVVLFGGREDITFTAKETSLFASLTPIKTALAEAGAQQSGGNRGFRENSSERLAAAISTRVLMRDIAEIAKALAARGVDVGAEEAFRMPPSTSYVSLAAAAQAFLDLAEPRKALFIERGLSATFDTELAALIATLSTAGDTAGTERARQRGGTAGLDAQVDAGMEIVRELRAILRVKFRSNPALLAEWTSVARVHTPVRAKKVPATPPGGSGSGSGDGSGSGSTTGS